MNPERGFVLPAAIFLLVALTAMATLLMRITASAMGADALEFQGERAYQAAQAGVESGIYTALKTTNCDASLPWPPFRLGDFKMQVDCLHYTTSEPKADGTGNVSLYMVASRASYAPGGISAPTSIDYAERRVTATIEK